MKEFTNTPHREVAQGPESATEASRLKRVLWLRTLFGDTSEHMPMGHLAARVQEFTVAAGTSLFDEAGPADALYFVVEGAIRHGAEGYTLFTSGDVLGYVDAAINRPHRFTATVERDATVLRLMRDDWLEYLEDNFEVLRRNIMSTLESLSQAPDEEAIQVELARTLVASERAPTDSGAVVHRLLATRACPLLRHASIQALAHVVRGAETISLTKGERFSPQRRSIGIWLVASGVARLDPVTDDTVEADAVEVVGEAKTTSKRYPGMLLYAASALVARPTSADVTALEDTVLLHLATEDYFDIMEDHFDLARSALAYLAARVEEQNRRWTDEAESRSQTFIHRG